MDLQEKKVLQAICARARKICRQNGQDLSLKQASSALAMVHESSCPLDLHRMAKATDENLMHDVMGIISHLNWSTGELNDCFLPRHALAAGGDA